MSHVEIAKLKGINDGSLSWDSLPFLFTTAQFRIDTLTRFNSYIRAFRIINRDAIANLTYRYDQPGKTLVTIDPLSFDEQEFWTSYLEINPNGVTGTGEVELDLVPRNIAEKKLFRGQLGR